MTKETKKEENEQQEQTLTIKEKIELAVRLLQEVLSEK